MKQYLYNKLMSGFIMSFTKYGKLKGKMLWSSRWCQGGAMPGIFTKDFDMYKEKWP